MPRDHRRQTSSPFLQTPKEGIQSAPPQILSGLMHACHLLVHNCNPDTLLEAFLCLRNVLG